MNETELLELGTALARRRPAPRGDSAVPRLSACGPGRPWSADRDPLRRQRLPGVRRWAGRGRAGLSGARDGRQPRGALPAARVNAGRAEQGRGQTDLPELTRHTLSTLDGPWRRS